MSHAKTSLSVTAISGFSPAAMAASHTDDSTFSSTMAICVSRSTSPLRPM
jgi:hypothetical protein